MAYQREARGVQAAKAEETEPANLSEYLNDALDRRGNVRAPALKHLLEVVLHDWIGGEENIDKVLEIASGALDGGRDFSERLVLVRIAGSLLLHGKAPHDFAEDFGEALGKLVPHLLESDAPADFVAVVFHALVVAEAITENSIAASASKLLSSWLIESIHLTKRQMCPENIAAAARALAIISTDPADAEGLGRLIRHALIDCVSNDPALSSVVAKAAGVAFETYGETSDFNPLLLDMDESRMPDNKKLLKQWHEAVRDVKAFMGGESPSVKITLTKPGSKYSDTKEIEITSVVKLAVLESMRALIGDEYYGAMLDSPVLQEYFGEINRDGEARAARRIRYVDQLSDRHNEQRKFSKARASARDRKRADVAEE